MAIKNPCHTRHARRKRNAAPLFALHQPLWTAQGVLAEALHLVDESGQVPHFNAPPLSAILFTPRRRPVDWEPKARASVSIRLPIQGGRFTVTVEQDYEWHYLAWWFTDIRTMRAEGGHCPDDEHAPERIARSIEDYAIGLLIDEDQRTRAANPEPSSGGGFLLGAVAGALAFHFLHRKAAS